MEINYSNGAEPEPRLLSRINWSGVVTSVTLTLWILLAILPIGFLIYASFRSGAPRAPNSTWTLDNWVKLLSPGNLKVIYNTLKIAFFTTFFTVSIGSILAWLVSRTDMPYRNKMGMAFITPMLLSPMLTVYAWVILASGRSGMINVLYRSWTGAEGWILNIFSVQGIILVLVLSYTPFAYLVIVSALRSMDASLEDASRMSGAGILSTLWHVTLPVVAPAILSAALLIFVLSSEQFSVPTLLGLQAKIPTLQYTIFTSMIDSPTSPPYAAAAGCLLLIIGGIGLLLYNRATRLSRRFVTVSGKASAPKLINLGPWRWVGLGFGFLYLFLALIAPYGALLMGSFMKYVTPDISLDLFTWSNHADVYTRTDTVQALKNTFTITFISATIAVAAAGYISYMLVRVQSQWTRALGFVVMLPLSVPAISLGLGLLWAYLYIPIGVYGTIVILVIAFVTRYTPQGVRNLTSSIIQIDPELEQGARIHGASPLSSLWHITTPLVRSALISAWVLLFIQMTHEVSMSIMLYTSKTVTASLIVWFFYTSDATGVAYSMAFLLATISFVVVLLGNRIFGTLQREV